LGLEFLLPMGWGIVRLAKKLYLEPAGLLVNAQCRWANNVAFTGFPGRHSGNIAHQLLRES